MLGIYISGHPLKPYEKELKQISSINTAELYQMVEGVNGELSQVDEVDGMNITIGGIIVAVKNKLTKNNNMMAFLVLEDLYGSIEVIVFPKIYDGYLKYIKEDSIVVIEGSISSREEEEPKVICNKITPLNSFNKEKLYIRLKGGMDSESFNVLKGVFKKYSGNVPVYIYLEEEGKVAIAERNLWVDIKNENLIR